MQAAIRAADAGALVTRALTREEDPGRDRAVSIIAAGKAALSMVSAAMTVLGSSVRGGVVVAPSPLPVPPPLQMIVGEHPEPGPGSEAAGQQALAVATSTPANGQLLVLLSGGASSLMTVPVQGIALSEKRRTSALLMRAGADIHALNTVRKHLSDIKGGWLAAKTPATCRTFAISDVVGDDLSVIGSGPTVADRSTFADASRVLEERRGDDSFPPAVVAHIAAGMRGARTETPKPGDPRLARSEATVVGSRFDAMHGAARAARERGYHTVVVDDPVQGEARVAGLRYVAHALEILAAHAGRSGPLCIVSSGETTVTVRGRGRGGRNQELALAAVEPLSRSQETVALASAGTDGVDGPTDAAGAIADSTTLARARAAGLGPPDTFLDNNDSHAFFAPLGDLLHTGPTGTNVGDLQVILLA